MSRSGVGVNSGTDKNTGQSIAALVARCLVMSFLYPVLSLILIAVIAWIVNNRMPAEGTIRPIVNIVASLIVVGVVLWLINTYIPMAGSIKAILNIVVVVATCVFVLKAFGLWGGIVRLWANFTSRLNPR